MTTLYAAICDDEPLAMNMVASALSSCFQQQGVTLELEEFTSPLALLKAFPDRLWSVVFLDIEMPEMDGIEAGKRIHAINSATDIVYISNCEDRVFDAFSSHPFGFVRKSSFLKDAESVARLYISEMQKRDTDHYLELRVHGDLLRLKLSEVSYIECDRDIQHIHQSGQDEPVTVQLRMKHLEEKLTPMGFIRVHTGYLVNYTYIRRIEQENIQLQDGSMIPVSRRRRQDILEKYMKLCRTGNQAGNGIQ